MKERYCLILLLVIVICGCRDRREVSPVIITPDYKRAQSFLDRQPDSAFYYFNKIATGSRDSLLIAIAYSNMAQIQADKGDYFGSQETLLSALRFLNEQKGSNFNCLVSVYNQLGRNSSDLKNYSSAIDYYDLALKFSGDKHFREIALNNKAVAYRDLRKYDQAIAIYESIYRQSEKSRKEFARVLTNLALVRWLRDPAYRAAPDLLTALKIRKAENDDWGLNSSYAHLADYYASSHPDSALFYAGEMYAVARRLGSPDDELEALQKLILLGAPGDVKKYFTTYQRLSDSLQTARNSAKNQFAVIRYEAEKNKVDNLRLQQENAERKVELFRERALLTGAIAVFVVVVGWLYSWFRRRRRRSEQEAADKIRDNELRVSRKVHDVVANGLYRIMTGIEHRGEIEKERLLDEIEVLYEQSRDISYETSDAVVGDFQLFVAGLLGSFSGPNTRVLVIGNDSALWDAVHFGVKKELPPILQELMTNMHKHSEARNVVVRFAEDAGNLRIRYTDDGIGFTDGLRFGNGLTNTGNRIRGLGGGINFGENRPSGLTIDITIPN